MVRALLFFSALRPLEWAKPLILLLILSSASSANAIDVQVGQAVRPEGAVILVVDGLGASYVYPEHNAYALDGTLLKKALLFNLTGSGARVVDLRVPVPETTKSHSVLVTGDSDVDPQLLGPTIFDAARKEGYLCLAVLERGDAMPMLQEMDAVLYLEDNSISGSEPITGFRAGTPAGLCSLFQEWRDKFASYTEAQGVAGYAGYNCWGLDAAADIVEHLLGNHFLMLVNVGAVDSAGHNLGLEGYLEAVAALDVPLGRLAEACRKNNVLLIITADHGMSFQSTEDKGGHSAEKYAKRLEALRVPLVVLGPGIDELNLGGRWSEVDIAPTVLNALNISCDHPFEGQPLPIKCSYDLSVVGAPEGVALLRDGRLLANASGDWQYNFKGLERGLYSIQAGGESRDVLMNGDLVLDLTDRAAPLGSMKKIIAVIIIMTINLAGAAVIIRIWRR
ncbi:MAG: phosphoglyceromutase [Methanosaeta sp. PtaU1.Bin016]|nr:MAG: phosphoglyceromutase [Methanosaeta sp. PtaU1.Bin016]